MHGKSGFPILASQHSPSPARQPRRSSSESPLASTEMIANPLIRPLARRLASNLAAMDGGGTPAMPGGALGIWYGADYSATPRPQIPNSIASAPLSSNLLNMSRKAGDF